MTKTTFLINARLLAPNDTLQPGVIAVKDGRILHISAPGDLLTGIHDQILDLDGLVISPGWIDIQFNGAFGHDFTAAPHKIWQVAEKLPQYGVTAFLPTIITAPPEAYTNALAQLRLGPPPGWRGARPLGLHIEGPFLNPEKKGAHDPNCLRLPDQEIAQAWSVENGVRLVTLAPELPGSQELIQQLCARGVVVSAGHTLASYEDTLSALEAGVTSATHLFNAMPPLDHRQPGLGAAVLADQRPVAGMIVDGIHVHPVMVALAWRLKGNAGLALVTDAMAALGMPPGKYRLAGFDVIVDETSARLADGTLAGSILSLDQSLRNLMRFTGCTLGEALPSLCRTPARLLNLPAQHDLQPGSSADLTVLTPDGQVMLTMVGGEILFDARGG